MSLRPLFSIVLLHYNQPAYVKNALNSIFAQTYNNIELIFADDASTQINIDDLRQYVDTNKKENIHNIIWQINETNLGTIRSINRALEKATGKYLLFFAADDILDNENVVQSFADALASSAGDVYMVSAQCHMMDKNLEKDFGIFVNPSFAFDFNNYSAVDQYKTFARNCFLAIGATAMKMEMFQKFGKFSEEYKLVEDWSYFLHLTRAGGKVQFHNFDALLHRDGGMSHYNEISFVPRYVMDYKYDLVRIFENEVLAHFRFFSYHEQLELYNTYLMYKNDYLNAKGEKPTYSYFKQFKVMPKFVFKKMFSFLMESFDAYKWKMSVITLKASIFWASLALILNFARLESAQSILTCRFVTSLLEFLVNNAMPLICGAFTILFVGMLILTLLNKFRLAIKKSKMRIKTQGEKA